MSDLKDLQNKVVRFRDARNWKQFHDSKEMALSLTLEAAELLELFQWTKQEDIETHVSKKKVEISEELSDILYWILLLANDAGINLEKSFLQKMAKNAKKYPISKAKNSKKKYTEL